MQSAKGFVLKKIDVGEDAALFLLYTRDFGKIRVIAQGVRKEKAKLRGHLELLNLVNVQFVSAKNGMRATYANLEEYWPNIRDNWRSYSLARYMIELTDSVCFERDQNEALWLLLLECFAAMNQKDFSDHVSLKSSFELRFSKGLGYTKKEDLNINLLDLLIKD